MLGSSFCPSFALCIRTVIVFINQCKNCDEIKRSGDEIPVYQGISTPVGLGGVQGSVHRDVHKALVQGSSLDKWSCKSLQGKSLLAFLQHHGLTSLGTGGSWQGSLRQLWSKWSQILLNRCSHASYTRQVLNWCLLWLTMLQQLHSQLFEVLKYLPRKCRKNVLIIEYLNESEICCKSASAGAKSSLGTVFPSLRSIALTGEFYIRPHLDR